MTMMRSFIPVVSLFAVAACAGSHSSGGTSRLLTRLSEDVPFSGNSGFSDSTTMVIRDSTAWRSAWERIHSWTSTPPALPSIDFTSRMVLLAATGTKGSGGYGIEIRAVTTSATSLTARVRTTVPGPSCFTSMALTEPVDIVTVPLFEGTVHFRYEAAVIDCEE